MRKLYPAVLLWLLVQVGHSQNLAGSWKAAGEYLTGLSITTVMKKMAAQKNLYFIIDASGNVSGTLVTSYNKSKAVIPYEGSDQYFTLTGKCDFVGKQLLLVITHFRSRPDTSESYLTFRKPDSVYYDLSFNEFSNSIATGIANKTLNTNTTAEWVGSFRGGGLGMNISENISMHILPLRIRFNSFERSFQQANMPALTTQLPLKDVTKDALKDDAPKILSRDKVTVVRKTEIQRTIVLDTSFIKLDLYDNGEIDGDIATLILDGKTIINQQLLSAKAASVSLNLSRLTTEHILELFADNMGSIPPNTALLVLTCKNKRYEINLSSTEKANGSLRLVFKPD